MAPLPPSKGEAAGLSGESSAPVLLLMLGRDGGGGARVAAGPPRGYKGSCVSAFISPGTRYRPVIPWHMRTHSSGVRRLSPHAGQTRCRYQRPFFPSHSSIKHRQQQRHARQQCRYSSPFRGEGWYARWMIENPSLPCLLRPGTSRWFPLCPPGLCLPGRAGQCPWRGG